MCLLTFLIGYQCSPLYGWRVVFIVVYSGLRLPR